MRHLHRFIAVNLLIVAAASAGCHFETIQSGGFAVSKKGAERAFREVTNRAAFDLSCPKEQLDAVVLNTSGGYSYSFYDISQIGVSGCDRKAVYVYTLSGWVMNAASEESTSRGVQKP
jgi:hypothetical protein